MRTRKRKSVATVLGALLGVMVAVTPLRAQERGTVTGRVVDNATRQPITGAQVVVTGTTQGTLTNAQGEYRIAGVRAGSVTVRAVMLGYDTQERTVALAVGATATAEFALAISAVALNEVVVTVTGEQRKKELANAVNTIAAPQVVQSSPITSVDQLLNGRAAGVQVLGVSGTVGTGSRIRVRGANSVSLLNEPVMFIDGVRVYSDPNTLSIGVGGMSGSRLNDLNPEDIESVEVVKGPSAAALYGTDAANGVVRITTKRGRAGVGRWNVYFETGALTDPNKYPLNYRGKVADSPTAANCLAYQVGSGSCTQAALLSYQPLTDPLVTPFKTGSNRQYGLSVSGGGDIADYYVSGDFLNQVGVLGLTDSTRSWWTSTGQSVYPWQEEPNQFRRVNLRGNFGARPREGLSLRIANGYVSERAHFPQNDNNAAGIIPSGLLGSYSSALGTHGYGYLAPAKVFVMEVMQEIDRYTNSVQADWHPTRLAWLQGRATVGVDMTDRHDSYFSPPGAVTELSAVQATGQRSSNRIQNHSWTADGSASANHRPWPWLSTRTTVGTQYFHQLDRRTTARGEGLTPGTKSVGASSAQFASELTTEAVTLGLYGEEQLGIGERLFVNLAARGDDNSSFGRDYGFVVYPKAGASYVVRDESAEPLFGLIRSVRLRTAWGASGVSPRALDALGYYNASVTAIAGADKPGVSFGELGNADLKPERSTELEGGFDADFFDGRAGLQLTVYTKTTRDALIQRTLARSPGASTTRFENIGSVGNRGGELTLNATPIESDPVRWDMTVSSSYNRNRLLTLGGAQQIISGKQRAVEGYSLFGYWDNRITYADANNDGIITPTEIKRDTAISFLGNALPTTQFSLLSSVTLFHRVRLSGLLDYKGGYKNYNYTEEFRCRSQICRGLNDTKAPLRDQARAVQAVSLGANRSADPFIEDAHFTKLRELSVTFLAPQAWARRVGARDLNLVLTGRNLGKWTNYTGLDPEINENGSANFQQDEFLTQPPIRQWLVRANISF